MANEWRRFVVVFALAASGALLAAAAAIAFIDPLAISPLRLISNDILPQTNRRYIVPAIVRSGRYDSYIVGTSTVHTLDPQEMARGLPGRFANVALLGSSPYEQSRVVALIGREVRGQGNIIWGLDANWCATDAASLRTGPEVLPEWLYDENRWNDLTHSFNWAMLDMARRKLLQALRPEGKRLQADGYSNMLPPDDTYHIDKARKLIYGPETPRQLPTKEPRALDLASLAEGQLPGAAMLKNVLARLPAGMRVIFVLMPSHAFGQPAYGSDERKTLRNCKAAIAGAAAKSGAWLLDAMWHSVWTIEDANFWDRTHYRDHLAHTLIREIGRAVNGDTPTLGLRVLVRGL